MLAQSIAFLVFILCEDVTTAEYSNTSGPRSSIVCSFSPASMQAATPGVLLAIASSILLFCLLGAWVVSLFGRFHSGVWVRPRKPKSAQRVQSGAPCSKAMQASCLLVCALACALFCCWALIMHASGCDGLLWLVHFAFDESRGTLMAWWAVVLLCVVPFVHVAKKRRAEKDLQAKAVTSSAAVGVPKIVVRKAFHAVAVAMFLPGILLDIDFTAIACAGALLLLLAVDFLRAVRAPLFGAALHKYMVQFTDVRDNGALILTHVYLLIGCASPLWYLVAARAAGATFSPKVRLIIAAGGILSVGIGDSAAAVVGTLHGRIRWPNTRKTLEGSAAACVSMFIATQLLVLFVHNETSLGHAPADIDVVNALGLSAFVSIVETFCDVSDNLLLPLQWALISAMMN